MQQKFTKLEDAAEKLGVSPDQLNGLRENGQLRAYRDGPSWKFRTDEIEKMAQEGVPEISSESDIGFALLDEEELAPITLDDDSAEVASNANADEPNSDDPSSDDPSPDESGLDLELELEDTDPVSAGSELELSDMEDTVTAGTSDPHLDLPDEPSDPSDSILLSEEELGESMSPSGSILVGKDVLKADADLELATDDDTAPPLHEDQGAGASNVLSSESSTGDVLDQLELESNAGGASGFEDLEELEIDLAAESSRILSPDELEKVQAAASQPVGSLGGSDLALDDSDVDSDMGSTDVPLLDADASAALEEEGSGSEIDLAGDNDLVLEDTEGSDITLGSGDSGINLAPADSGLALDDIPLEIGGSAILSSLDLGGADSDPEISLIGSAPDSAAQEPEAELQTDEDFQLTPLSKGASAEEGDSSSQVIALDADIENFGDLGDDGVGVLDDVGVLDGDVDFSEDVGEDVMIAEDFASADPDGSLEVGAYAGAAAVGSETPFSVGQLVGLFGCGVLMSLAGVMMLDMVRNIWSWDEPYSLSSSLIDSILGLFS